MNQTQPGTPGHSFEIAWRQQNRTIREMEQETACLRDQVAKLRTELTKALEAVADMHGEIIRHQRQPHNPTPTGIIGK